MAVEARHGLGDHALKRTQQIAHVLRIELCRQRGRIDEIAEHHGHMTPFGCVLRFRLHGRDFADRAQYLQPVSERNTEVFEVLIGQLGQNVGLDLVFTKYGFVLTEAETVEPSPDIHGRAPLQWRWG